MATPTQVKDAISTAMVEISEARVQRWQEGDKRGEFHRLDHLARAWKLADQIEEHDAEDVAGCGVGFVT